MLLSPERCGANSRRQSLYKHQCDTCGKTFIGLKTRRYCCLGCSPRKGGSNAKVITDQESVKRKSIRNFVRQAIRHGKIKKEPCKICGDPNSEAHHDDYDKPLEIIWLCKIHHEQHQHT